MRWAVASVHAALLQHVDHVVHLLLGAGAHAGGEEGGGVHRALGIRRAPADIVSYLELNSAIAAPQRVGMEGVAVDSRLRHGRDARVIGAAAGELLRLLPDSYDLCEVVSREVGLGRQLRQRCRDRLGGARGVGLRRERAGASRGNLSVVCVAREHGTASVGPGDDTLVL